MTVASMGTSHQSRGFPDGGGTAQNTYNSRDIAIPSQNSYPRSPGIPQNEYRSNGGASHDNNSSQPLQSQGYSLRPPQQQQGGGNGESRDLAYRDKTKLQTTTSSRKEQKVCASCGEPLTGQFVRALNGTYHLECFRCRDCGQVVASKFFPAEDNDVDGQYPLCEVDYFRRLDLICFKCGGALRSSYVTALEHKYHIEHFTCSVCPTAFGASDSYYEHNGLVYCHYHYSTRFAQRCNGCQTAILKQFVEIFRNGENQHWHPECYMIHKFWNVKLAKGGDAPPPELPEDASDEERDRMRHEEEQMEERQYRIWSVLSQFEETSAACISDMLLHVSNGALMEGVLVAKKFITYVDVLFDATDRLDKIVMDSGKTGLSYGREAKLLCKRIVAFFTLLTKTSDTGVKRLGVTQELLSLVTGLAHYLKLLIRISLQGALRLERESGESAGLNSFLDDLTHIDILKDANPTLDDSASMTDLADDQSDLCFQCQQPIDDECLKASSFRWHQQHMSCYQCGRIIGDELGLDGALFAEKESKSFCPNCARNVVLGTDASPVEHVTRLQQYVYLLQIALARLLAVLRSSGTLPHTSDDPNLATYDSSEGHRLTPSGTLAPPMLSADNRSKSFGGITEADKSQNQSSYEQTVGEMKRLRSTRMEKALSTTLKKARTSRIIDGPEAQNLASQTGGSDRRRSAFHIVEDHDLNGTPTADLAFGHQDALTLDDIPRIVAAEQAKEQRPNAYRHAQDRLISGGRQARLASGHDRTPTFGEGQRSSREDNNLERPKKFFSELSGLEYFIVRHVAVLQMQPLLESHFTLEDLLTLIETRKQTFWGKLFKNDKAKNAKKKGVFGVSLDVLIEREGVESTFGVGPGALRVPSLLDESIAAMRGMDMSVEGVFRKNGNIRGLKDLAERIDTKESEVDLTKESPVQVAALLKKFLREMPDPLLTHKLYELFITSQKIPDETKRKRVLHLTCCLLPKTHRDCVEILFSFLNWTASFSQVDEESGSKMDTHNLATVVAPNILYADPKTGTADESFLAIEAINMLLEYNDSMCEVPEDIQSVLSDTELFNSMPEVTTKEILKRYGEIARRPAEVHQSPSTSWNEQSQQYNGAPRAGITRVDTDPDQMHAWQKESSVRHVQQNGQPGTPSYPQINQSTPPQLQNEFHPHRSPYSHHHRMGSGDSLRSNGGTPNRHSHRPSNFSRGPPTGQQQEQQLRQQQQDQHQRQQQQQGGNWDHSQ